MEHFHFVGIGGTGLSAIAKVLLEQGYTVSGSDLTSSSLSEAVRESGGIVYLGHQAENIQGADTIIRSSAVPESNVEVQAAKENGIPVLKRSEFLGRLMEDKNVIAIAGSHGKTTTTSMVTWILTALEREPSFIVGGVVANLETNAQAGDGDDFVIEADEYDYMFLGLNPSIAVVTNVEHDHPDIFPTAELFRKAFCEFVGRLEQDGTLILCGEDPGAIQLKSELKSNQKLFVYGFDSGYDYSARKLRSNLLGGVDFEIVINNTKKQETVQISLQLPGDHNVLNAVGAFAVSDQIGLNKERSAEALGNFIGSERRFDIRGDFKGVTLIDDYAHHPTEIKATLAAARTIYPNRRIWAVWQPHTYSRTETLFTGFTQAFSEADKTIVLNVFAAREEKPEGFKIIDLVNTINKSEARLIPDKNEAAAYLLQELIPGDVLLVFSAGDAIEINDELERTMSAEYVN